MWVLKGLMAVALIEASILGSVAILLSLQR